MDLGCAFPDSFDASVTPESLYRKFLHQAHTAKDLERVVGNTFAAIDEDFIRIFSPAPGRYLISAWVHEGTDASSFDQALISVDGRTWNASGPLIDGWQRITGETPGELGEVAACLLLADRNGAASRAQIEAFHRVIAEIAPTLPAAWLAAPVDDEAARAEELDRLGGRPGQAVLTELVDLTADRRRPPRVRRSTLPPISMMTRVGWSLRGKSTPFHQPLSVASLKYSVNGRFMLGSCQSGFSQVSL